MGIEPTIKLLQSLALPLGYPARYFNDYFNQKFNSNFLKDGFAGIGLVFPFPKV